VQPGVDVVVRIPLGQIQISGISVRTGPLNRSHLASLVGLNGNWPPIVVWQKDYSIIDGYYRFLAAGQLGYPVISCQLFNGEPEAAYLEALRRNLACKLPLSLRERELAAVRVLKMYGEWSDRRVASLCALAPATVRRLRAEFCPTDGIGQLDMRIGQDNRRRPVDRAALRRSIADAMRSDPGASLRKIAQLVNCSPETVRSARRQPSAPSAPSQAAEDLSLRAAAGISRIPQQAAVTARPGAAFAAWFSRTAVSEQDSQNHVNSVPLSGVRGIAAEARRRAAFWQSFAGLLEARGVKAVGGTRDFHF
jgi:ParB-like chromosome segregation protein Spo0J